MDCQMILYHIPADPASVSCTLYPSALIIARKFSCTIPSLLNYVSISSLCLAIFSGSQSMLALMIRSPSGVRIPPCS